MRLSEDDYQIPHGDFDGIQPILSTGENRTTISLLFAWECACKYEDRHKDITQGVKGEELCPG
jgi:hypothetical protein